MYFRIFQLSYTLLCGCCGQLLLEKLERVLWLTTYLGKLFSVSSCCTSINLSFLGFLCLCIKVSDKLLFLFSNATLQQISKRVPRTKEELLDINGISK